MIGEIKKLVADKLFGFIRRTDDDVHNEYFFHATGCVGGVATFSGLRQGQKVTFEVDENAKPGKGPRAWKVFPAV